MHYLRPRPTHLLLLVLYLALPALAMQSVRPGPAISTPSTLAGADKAYAEKSYASALPAYQRLLDSGQVPPARQDEVRYRICVSLGKAKKWDQALERSLEFVKTHRGTVWEPRGLYWLGRLYVAVPHMGWKVGDKLYRGHNLPAQAGNARPEQVQLYEQDLLNAVDALEAARVLYPRHRTAGRTEPEEVQLNFDLARMLQSDPRAWAWLPPYMDGPKEKQNPAAPEWKVDAAQEYDPTWPAPKKLMYLFAQLRTLAPRDANPVRTRLLADLAQGLWLWAYHDQARASCTRWENDKTVRIPYPYEKVSAEALLRGMLVGAGETDLRAQAHFTLARQLHQRGRLVEAASEYERLIAQRPKSKWVSDARLALFQLRQREVSVDPTTASLPGKQARINISHRNVTGLRIEVYPFRLTEALAYHERRRRHEENWSEVLSGFGSIASARSYYGKRVAAWSVPLKGPRNLQPRSTQVPLPVSSNGAYVVEVSGEGVKAAGLLIVSDLMLVQKVHRDGALFYAANAKTGQPVAGVPVVAHQWWSTNTGTGREVTRTRTTGQGVATVALARKAGRTGFRVAALAHVGTRFALTGPAYTDDQQDNPNTFRVYSVTDRSVYRPQQVVHFREIALHRSNGQWKPLAGTAVKVDVNGPTGSRVHHAAGTTSEFGSFHGSFVLPEGAPLGEYTVSVTVPGRSDGPNEFGGNRFRVEEYKKPEFEVAVQPTADRVRLGERATASIQARYYFGGPVADAKVTYRVHRGAYAQSYRFPRPFDFLYEHSGAGDYDQSHRNGPVVIQGETRTDSAGNAEISFPTKPDARFGDTDFAYSVEVDVMDSSRRTISGSGTVKATRADVAVFMDFPRGYARQGELVEVEILTLNPSDQPVSVSGTARVIRDVTTPKGREKEVYQTKLRTDAQGRTYLRWRAAQAGYYLLQFETHDSAQQAVHGSHMLFVEGLELRRTGTIYDHVEVLSQKQYYAAGETAKVLLVTPAPGCSVLLTREANNEALGQQVVHVPGRSLEVELPLTARDAPNVYLTAALVRDGQVKLNTRELFIPPASQFARVSVTADRAQYEPGQKAKLQLKATDWQGRPLRTELSVSVSDASLSYIQKSYSPDIRTYYYGQRRSQSVPQNGSADTSFSPLVVDHQSPPRVPSHGWTYPDGMGLLPDWPGSEGGGPHWYYQPGMGGGGGYFGIATDSIGAMPAAPASPTEGTVRHRVSANPFTVNSELREVVKSLPAKKQEGQQQRQDGDTGVSPDASVRRRFEDTAFWTPVVRTDAQGVATAEVEWPDNLTRWQAKAVGNSATAQVGSGDTQVTTKKDLLVRLQTPRFFVERDRMVISANIHNYTGRELQTEVRLALEGETAHLEKRAPGQSSALTERRVVTLPAQGEVRVDWPIVVTREGSLKVRVSAEAGTLTDATENRFPVLVHGVERFAAQSGVLRTEKQARLAIPLPAERKPGSSELVVQLHPSLAGTMLDALPYLIEYPYGCIEQTVSRFMPAVVVARTLKEQGYDLEDLGKRARLLDELAARPAQPGKVANSPYTYPDGRPGTMRTEVLTRGLRTRNSPVFNTAYLRQLVTQGVARIASLQHGDGGWGWWASDVSDPYMTAYVVQGLTVSREAGYLVDPQMLERAVAFLLTDYHADEQLHRLAYTSWVLAGEGSQVQAIRPIVTGRLYERRERLTPYSKALLAMALHTLGEKQKAEIVLSNIETTARIDANNGTASWENENRNGWYWWNNQVETNATVLEAYVRIRPQAPLPAMLVKWLVNNRRNGIWHSTRETAVAVQALARYARAHRELDPEYTLTVDLGGRVRRQYTIDRTNALLFDNQFVVPDELLRTGDNALTITKEGPGTLYFNAFTRYFSLEEPIRATGNEIFVRRCYFRLLPGTASGTAEYEAADWNRPNPFLTGKYELLTLGGVGVESPSPEGGPRYERVPLQPGEPVSSGDMLEVELFLESKNEYDYLLFEDLKPAGCEPVELRSGGRYEGGVCSNVEYRDQKVAFFFSHLPQGTRAISYRLRAEFPGRFHVLPTNGYAMYAPDIRCLSNETELQVRD